VRGRGVAPASTAPVQNGGAQAPSCELLQEARRPPHPRAAAPAQPLARWSAATAKSSGAAICPGGPAGRAVISGFDL